MVEIESILIIIVYYICVCLCKEHIWVFIDIYYGRNNGNYMNKMNSERHDILPNENKEEEKKEV